MDKPKKERCRHGMVPVWCAYCTGNIHSTREKATTGRGVGRIFGDTRPMKIWRKEQ